MSHLDYVTDALRTSVNDPDWAMRLQLTKLYMLSNVILHENDRGSPLQAPHYWQANTERWIYLAGKTADQTDGGPRAALHNLMKGWTDIGLRNPHFYPEAEMIAHYHKWGNGADAVVKSRQAMADWLTAGRYLGSRAAVAFQKLACRHPALAIAELEDSKIHWRKHPALTDQTPGRLHPGKMLARLQLKL